MEIYWSTCVWTLISLYLCYFIKLPNGYKYTFENYDDAQEDCMWNMTTQLEDIQNVYIFIMD